MGHEDQALIAPAIVQLAGAGMDIRGPPARRYPVSSRSASNL